MRWKKESAKAILIAVGFTLFLAFPLSLDGDSWGYFFGFGLTVFELPVLIESDELSTIQKVGLTFALGVLSVLLIWFFCEAERVDRYLLLYITLYGVTIPTLLLKRCYIKWKASKHES